MINLLFLVYYPVLVLFQLNVSSLIQEIISYLFSPKISSLSNHGHIR